MGRYRRNILSRKALSPSPPSTVNFHHPTVSRSLAERVGDYAGTGEAVADPFVGELEEYEACAERLTRLVALAVERLRGDAAKSR